MWMQVSLKSNNEWIVSVCKRGKCSINNLSTAAERIQIIDWLSPINFFLRQVDISRERQAGTGGWLLVDPHFQKWKYDAGRTLWCHGIRAWLRFFINAKIN
jgi:hypothetical protein